MAASLENTLLSSRENEEEEKAERAREFRTNLNRRRPSRKRYTSGNPFVAAGFDQSGQFDFTRSVNFSGVNTSTSTNPFLASTTSKSFDSTDGVPLTSVGGSTIFREIDEKESLSKAKNFCLELVPQPIRRSLLPPMNWKQWRNFLFVHLPILHWLWQYRPKQLIGDIIAGITIGVTHIPQGIGFSLLAGLPPVYGLYSSFVPVILYSVFGTSRHISVGTFPVVALMTGDAITRLTHEIDICNTFNETNGTLDTIAMETNPCAHSDCEQLKVDIAVTLSLLVGILMMVMSFLKFGFITVFLSDSLVSGYTAAAAFTIMITQIKFLFGLPAALAAIPSGAFVTPKRVIRFFDLIFIRRVVNGAAIVTAIICIILLIGLDYVNSLLRKYVKKVPIHIPAQLIVVILATGISYGAMLTKRFGLPEIELLGGILPGECFGVTLPKPSLFQKIVTDAFIIAIIGFVINISQAKLLAKKNSYAVHPDQEFLAYGIMNLGGSFFGSFPTAGALSRTVLQDATGGQTQLVGLISSGIVILVILFLGFLFGPLPNATLAAIVVVALKGLYLQVRDIYKYYILSWTDMFVWLVVFFSTLLIGLDIGLGIGVIFSLFVVVLRTILPYSPSLGETRAWHYPPDEKLGDDDFDEEDLKVYRIPKIYVYQFNAPLYFANVGVFHSRLHIETGISPCELGEPPEKGCIHLGCTKLCHCCSPSKSGKKKQKKKNNLQKRLNGPPLIPPDDDSSLSYKRFEDSISDESSISSLSKSPSPEFEEEKEKEEEEEEDDELKYHTIVIDCGPIGFSDSMGVTVLEQIVKEHDEVGIQILLAAPPTPLCKALTRHGFFKRFSSEHLFPTVTSAVSFARDGNRVLALEQPEEPDISLASNLERQLLYSARPSLLDKAPIELEHRGRTHTEIVSPSHDQPVETESTV